MLKSPRAFVLAGFLLAAVGGTAAVSHAQTLIIGPGVNDGSFETPGVAGSPPLQYQPTGTPWTFSAGAGISQDTDSDTSFSVNGPIPNGIQYAFLQLSSSATPATISQTFSLAQASDLSISYYLGGRDSVFFHGFTRFSASLDGTQLESTLTGDSMPFAQRSFFLSNISSGAHTLTFTATEFGLGEGDNTALLDDVRVTAVPAASAPEPGSLALAGVGLGAVMGFARGKRAK